MNPLQMLLLELAISVARPIIIKLVNSAVEEAEKNLKFKLGDVKKEKTIEILTNQIIPENNKLTNIQKNIIKDSLTGLINESVRNFNDSKKFTHK